MIFDAETALSSVTEDVPQLIISRTSLLSGAVVTWQHFEINVEFSSITK